MDNYDKGETSKQLIECGYCNHISQTHNVELSEDYHKVMLSCEKCGEVLSEDFTLECDFKVKPYSFRFGKYKGKSLTNVDDIAYLQWMFTAEKYPNNKLAIQKRLKELRYESHSDEDKVIMKSSVPIQPTDDHTAVRIKRLMETIPIPNKRLAQKLGKEDFFTLMNWLVQNVHIPDEQVSQSTSDWIEEFL